MSAVEKTVPTVDANNGGSGTSSLVKESYGHVDERKILDLALQRRTWWKVDLHIMTVAVLLYLASYIDRTNIGNARVLGMQAELHLTSGQYNWALSVFFIGYVLFETPSNIILKRLRPRIYIPFLTIAWGVVCCLVSVVQSAAGLQAIRFFLGIAEAGFLPGIIYWARASQFFSSFFSFLPLMRCLIQVGTWYPRHLQGRRFSVLYSSVSLTGAFGGLLATGIHALDGAHGIAGWRWIFIIEGVITIGFGLLSFIFMSDYPDTAPWLTPSEKDMINSANEADRALKASEQFDKKQILSAFTDYRTYLWGIVYLATYIPVYAVILSLPSVVAGLGYKGTNATLMACPPYGFGFILVLATGYTSDRVGDRFWHWLGGVVTAMVALIVLMTVANNIVRYAMFFLMMAMFVPISQAWSWLANNVAGTNKRAAATGVVFSMGNIGGAVAGQIYRQEWAPRYVQGHAVCLGCYVLALFACTLLRWTYIRDNRLRDEAAAARRETKQDMLGDDLGDLGDRHPNFRYYV